MKNCSINYIRLTTLEEMGYCYAYRGDSNVDYELLRSHTLDVTRMACLFYILLTLTFSSVRCVIQYWVHYIACVMCVGIYCTTFVADSLLHINRIIIDSTARSKLSIFYAGYNVHTLGCPTF